MSERSLQPNYPSVSSSKEEGTVGPEDVVHNSPEDNGTLRRPNSVVLCIQNGETKLRDMIGSSERLAPNCLTGHE
ncbi:unnamed protein product, partial [Allacma fusca]